MPITAAQNTAFFQDGDQMGLTPEKHLRLMHEGIQTMADLFDFDEERLKQVASNLSRPSLHIPDPTIGQPGGAAVGATIPCPPFPLAQRVKLDSLLHPKS
jgi:hypothetical protein